MGTAGQGQPTGHASLSVALKRDRTDRTRDDAFGVVRPPGTGTQAIYKQAQHCKTRAQFLYVNLKKKFPLDDVGDYK